MQIKTTRQLSTQGSVNSGQTTRADYGVQSWDLRASSGEHKMVPSLWKTGWLFLKELNVKLPVMGTFTTRRTAKRVHVPAPAKT